MGLFLYSTNLQKVEGFVKLAENAVVNLESLRHRLNNAKECLVHRLTDNACNVTVEMYDATKESIVQTVNTGR